MAFDKTCGCGELPMLSSTSISAKSSQTVRLLGSNNNDNTTTTPSVAATLLLIPLEFVAFLPSVARHLTSIYLLAKPLNCYRQCACKHRFRLRAPPTGYPPPRLPVNTVHSLYLTHRNNGTYRPQSITAATETLPSPARRRTPQRPQPREHRSVYSVQIRAKHTSSPERVRL